jgi:hypothetical protein
MIGRHHGGVARAFKRFSSGASQRLGSCAAEPTDRIAAVR